MRTYLKIANKITLGSKILELGPGQEIKEARFYLDKGYRVFCIDKKGTNFPYQLTADFRRIFLGKEIFSLIYARASLQYGNMKENIFLVQKIHKALLDQGLFFGTLHSPKDYMIQRVIRQFKKTKEPRTFMADNGQKIHFFNKKDIKIMLSDFKIEYIKEIRFKDKPHDGLEAHWHHAYEFLAQKK